MSKKRIIVQILEILAGILLLGLGIAGKVDLDIELIKK